MTVEELLSKLHKEVDDIEEAIENFARKRDNAQDPDRVVRYRRKIERLIKRSDNLQDAIDIIKERAT